MDNMYHFSIIDPFILDWRRVAPRGFEELELFITPKISLVLKDVYNSSKVFKIGAYILNDANAVAKFQTEIMPQRSFERIEKSFKDTSISCFFKFEEAEDLKKLFEEEQFLCRKLEINSSGRRVSLFELSADDFELVADELNNLRAVNLVDFTTDADQWKKTVKEMEDMIYERVSKEMRHRDTNKIKESKKRLFKKLGIGVAVGAVSLGISLLANQANKSGTLSGKSIGGILTLATWFGNSVAKHYLDKSAKEVEGVMIK